MPPRPHRQAGFTLVELLITLALMAILMLIAVGPLDKFMHRGKIEGIARQTSSLMYRARFEAIQRSVPARVVADGPNHQVFGYVEMSNPLNAVFDAGVDRELGRYELPAGVSFLAKSGAENDDNAMWNMLGPAGAQWVEFDGSGAVVEATDAVQDMLPAVRLADTRENYLEVHLATRATGRVELRKWDDGAPADAYGTQYVTQGQYGRSWEWL
ncbi:MAG TPA: prepilin-type N-terminal cleavage/methylation domain-containing protein [Thermoanaerobaculia bacterium]